MGPNFRLRLRSIRKDGCLNIQTEDFLEQGRCQALILTGFGEVGFILRSCGYRIKEMNQYYVSPNPGERLKET